MDHPTFQANVPSMNALIRRAYEAAVESKETIETHLAYLRKGLDDCKSDIGELRAEVRADIKSLREKMDQSYAKLDAKMDQSYAKLDTKLDKNQAETNAAISQLRESVASLREGVASLRGMQIAMVWIVGVVGTLGGLAVTLGKVFHWY
jgi:chromosome segregation ATPase